MFGYKRHDRFERKAPKNSPQDKKVGSVYYYLSKAPFYEDNEWDGESWDISYEITPVFFSHTVYYECKTHGRVESEKSFYTHNPEVTTVFDKNHIFNTEADALKYVDEQIQSIKRILQRSMRTYEHKIESILESIAVIDSISK